MAKKHREQPNVIEQPAKEQDNQAALPPIVRANVERRTEVSPSFASLYANDVQVQTTPWDLRLIFGEIASLPSGASEDTAITVKQVGEVRLSPQLAKKLTIILIQQLQGYEKRIGVIPVPED